MRKVYHLERKKSRENPGKGAVTLRKALVAGRFPYDSGWSLGPSAPSLALAPVQAPSQSLAPRFSLFPPYHPHHLLRHRGGVVDGFFVSNFAGKTPFAAVNFIYPVLMILGCVGFMFGTGGSALIALNLGMGDRKKADAVFSLVVYTAAVCGLVFALLGFWFVRPDRKSVV